MEEHSPQVSIVVPVYNAGHWLSRCLDSIQDQTFARWECILVDDGSTDGSGDICDSYAAKDPRFSAIHKANGGVSSARNAGMDAARAPILVFADADDAMAPDLLEQAVGMQITFLQWTCIGVPIVFILTPIAWFILVKMLPPEKEQLEGAEEAKLKYQQLGKLTSAEWKFIVIFIITLIFWLAEPSWLPLPVHLTQGKA